MKKTMKFGVGLAVLVLAEATTVRAQKPPLLRP